MLIIHNKQTNKQKAPKEMIKGSKKVFKQILKHMKENTSLIQFKFENKKLCKRGYRMEKMLPWPTPELVSRKMPTLQ